MPVIYGETVRYVSRLYQYNQQHNVIGLNPMIVQYDVYFALKYATKSIVLFAQ